MAGRNVATVSREIGVEQTGLGELLNLKRQPYRTSKGKARPGKFTLTAERIAAYFKMLPEDLFPASLYALGLPDGFDRTFDSKQVFLSLPTSAKSYLPSPEDIIARSEVQTTVDEVLRTLTPREATVLKLRFGIEGKEHTVFEVADRFKTAPSRITQISERALRKLRHSNRSRLLRPLTLEGTA
jgi:RNA polymerase sigma factor (sigma-70 family)